MKGMTIAGVLLATAATQALATDLNVVGLFPNKAVVQINGGAPRTLSVGQKQDGVVLLSSSRDSAEFEIDGKRRTLKLGQQQVSRAGTLDTASTEDEQNDPSGLTIWALFNDSPDDFDVTYTDRRGRSV